MQGNIIKQRSWHKNNFTIMHNEILFKKIQEKPISLEALGLLWRIMSTSKDWNLNFSGMASISGCSTNKINSCIKELEEAGYIKKEQRRTVGGQINGYNYLVYETTDQSLWTNEEITVDVTSQYNNIPQSQLATMDNASIDNSPQSQNPTVGKATVGKPPVAFGDQYNIKYINNKNINNYNNTEESDLSVTSSYGEKSENINTNILNSLTVKRTCNKQTQNLGAQSPLKGCEMPDEQQEAINEAKAQKGADKKKQRAQKRQQEFEKKIEAEQNKEYSSVDNVVDRTIGDNTHEDNVLAQQKKLNNEIEERLKENKQTLAKMERNAERREKILTSIKNTIERTIKNQALQIELCNFFTMWSKIGKPLTTEVYEAQMICLNNLSKDINIQTNIVRQSIQHGWTGFYELKETYKPAKQQTNTTLNTASTRQHNRAVDENGNPLLF